MKKKVNKKTERRYFKVGELRAKKNEDGSAKLEGFAIVFDSLSEKMGWFRERIVSTAFDNILGKSDCRCLFNHNEDMILGREKASTLVLEKRDQGIWMSVDLPDTQYARDLIVSVERGDIEEQSFCFIVEDDSWFYDKDTGEEIRNIINIEELIDVGPVTFGAYSDTTVAKRSYNKSKNEEEDFDLSSLESFLKSAPEEQRSNTLQKIDTLVSEYNSSESNDPEEITKPTLKQLRARNSNKEKLIQIGEE
ncbi:MAG: HK97 family phage prohead protease [Deltaproteobacteria bacterium]|nr:HK97 family phage prohead protease [Deltaproteobacteria bacterium]